MNQKHILSTFCSSKLNKAVKRPGKHYISNFNCYFPSPGDINFSQKVIVVFLAQIFNRKRNKERKTQERSSQKCVNISLIDSKGNIVRCLFAFNFGAAFNYRFFSLLLLSGQRMATIHVMSNYSIAVFSFMSNERFNRLPTACYLNPALNTELFISSAFFSGTSQCSI